METLERTRRPCKAYGYIQRIIRAAQHGGVPRRLALVESKRLGPNSFLAALNGSYCYDLVVTKNGRLMLEGTFTQVFISEDKLVPEEVHLTERLVGKLRLTNSDRDRLREIAEKAESRCSQ